MAHQQSRRHFLQSAAAGGAVLGLGDLGFLGQLPPLAAADLQPAAGRTPLPPDIEPVVRLIEDTPREELLERVADGIHKGLSYQEVLAALLLAGVCNVKPRPNVGFKFHAVLVVNSAHLASFAAPDGERWLPLFWALDYFKSARAQNDRENGGWRLGPVDESKVPSSRKARAMFTDALDRWDEPAADAAVVGLARTAGAQEVFEIFCRYGARDFRDIGHKAIFVANAWRTLQTIGWQYAEPVLRSLAFALLQHDGPNPATSDQKPDRPGRRNRELVGTVRTDWRDGRPSDAATAGLLAVLRQGSEDDAPAKVIEMLNGGTAPQSVWDALMCGAGELLLRQPGIVALHAVTTTNALRYAYETTANDETRRFFMLQNAAFLPLFRESLPSRGTVADVPIDRLEPASPKSSGPEAVAELFAEIGRDRRSAARKALGYLTGGAADPKALMDAGRLLVFFKGSDSHDYKFSSALMEDYRHVSPLWQDRYLAAGMMQLRGSGEPDIGLVKRTKAALKG